MKSFPVKVFLLDHIGEKSSLCEALIYADASPFERCKYIIKIFLRAMSAEGESTLEEILRRTNMSGGREEGEIKL